MSKTKTWMPLYIGDYLADTASLSTLQHGAYMLLMMEIWRNGPIQNNTRRLARVAKTDPQTWEDEIWPELQDFFTISDDHLDQKRLRAEREKAEEVSRKRSDAAAKRHASKQSSCKTEANEVQKSCKTYANAEQMHSKCTSDAHANDIQKDTQSQSQSHSYTSSLRSDGAAMPLRDVSAPGEPIAPEPSPDVRTQLFSEGLRRLRGITGQPEGKSRALIGRWLKATHDDASEVLRAIREAADLRPSDPVAWMEAAMRPKPRAMTRDEQVRATWGNIEIIPGT